MPRGGGGGPNVQFPDDDFGGFPFGGGMGG